MNREQFLAKLRSKLRRLPTEDVEDALEYYREYLDDAGPDNEAAAIAAWGSPDEVASKILADYARKRVDAEPSAKKGLSTVWVVILAIFASPIAVPVAAAAICVMFALIVAIASVIIGLGACAVGLAAGGLCSVIMGLFVTFQSFPTMIFYVGAGLVCIGVGIALSLLVIWLSKTGFHGVAKQFSKLLPGRKTT